MITSITKPSRGYSVKSKMARVRYVERITIPTLMKLFAISIVANKRFGFSSKLRISLFFFPFEFWISLSCCGLSEKNAISDPDTNAEQNSSSKITTKPIINSGLKGLKTLDIANIMPEYGSAVESSKVRLIII